MLEINNLCIHLSEHKLVSIDNATAASGKITGIVGPNGAGKSTLLKAIVNDLPSTGEINLQKQHINAWRQDELARSLAYLPQSSLLTFFFSAREVVELGAIPLSLVKHQLENKITDVMQMTDCLHLADQPFPLLSGGEKQRVQLARVLLQLCQSNCPPTLLLDEPLAALDIGQQHQVMTLLQRLATENCFTVLIVIHDLNHALRYCDDIWLMQDGNIVDQGTSQGILNKENISQIWQYPVEKFVTSSGKALIY